MPGEVRAPGGLRSEHERVRAENGVLPAYLRENQSKIERLAAEVGLDFFPTVFETRPTTK